MDNWNDFIESLWKKQMEYYRENSIMESKSEKALGICGKYNILAYTDKCEVCPMLIKDPEGE